MATPILRASLNWKGREISIRDLTADDVEALTDYWEAADDAFLERLGVDRERLGARSSITSRFLDMVPSGDPAQPRIAFAIEADARLIGYTNLNRYGPLDNISHWHIVDAAERGGGLSSALYPHRLAAYFASTDMERLTHQTRTGNAAMNRVLDRYVPVAETRYLERPDGLAAPGEFNIRHVDRADLGRIFAAARSLGYC